MITLSTTESLTGLSACVAPSCRSKGLKPPIDTHLLACRREVNQNLAVTMTGLKQKLVGASLSEPHTSLLNYEYRYICLAYVGHSVNANIQFTLRTPIHAGGILKRTRGQ